MPFSNGPDVEGQRPCAQEQDCHTYSEARVSESQHEVLHASLYIQEVLSTTLQKRRVKKVQVYIYIYMSIYVYTLLPSLSLPAQAPVSCASLGGGSSESRRSDGNARPCDVFATRRPGRPKSVGQKVGASSPCHTALPTRRWAFGGGSYSGCFGFYCRAFLPWATGGMVPSRFKRQVGRRRSFHLNR